MEALFYLLLGAALAVLAALAKPRVAGFLAQKPEDFAATSPAFDIREILSGDMRCEGVIYGPRGKVTSRFVADMHATWTGDTGRMTEDFRYDNGATQSRFWDLTVDAGGAIRAEAPDLVGTGRGRQAGAGVMLKYRLRLPEGSGGHVLDVTDWMYLMENGTIMNHSQFRKFGIKVAELVATIRPAHAEAHTSGEVAAE